MALGIQVDLGTFLQGQVFFCNTDKRIAELKCSIQSFLDEGMLLFSEALKLRGRMGFADCQLFGRLGRECFRQVTEHAYKSPNELMSR